MSKDSILNRKVTIAGYYGAGNTGDEAILGGIIQSLQEKGIRDITVMSRNPGTTRRMHHVKSIYIGARLRGLRRILDHLKESDLFILGGGGLLQDAHFRVVPFWLSRVFLAMLARAPVMYYAIGVGPLNTRFARWLVRAITNRVNTITVRDPASRTLLRACGVGRPPIEVTADPALCLRIASSGKDRLIEEGISVEENTPSIAVCLRSWKGEEHFLPRLVDCLGKLRRTHPIRYIFIPLHEREDRPISERALRNLSSAPSGYGDRILKLEHTPEQIAAILAETDGVIAMRLHAIILGALSNVPAFGLVYDPKVLRFMERASMFHSAGLDELLVQPGHVAEKMASWMDALDLQRERMKPAVEGMIQKAQQNAEMVRRLLERRP